MTNKFFHLGIALILVILLVLLSDPFMIWMPAGIHLMVLLVVSVAMCFWVGLIVQERSHDERETLHKMLAGRVAYLSGVVVLTVALVFQGLNHGIDPWIILALVVMVVSKLTSRLYSEYCL